VHGQLELLSKPLAAVTCVLLAVAACGGDDPSSSPQGAPKAGEHGTDRTDGGGAEDGSVTLTDLLGGDSLADRATQVREADRRRQELVRDCMADQGFDYVVHVTAGRVENAMGLPTDLTDEEFRRKYGYGIATGFEASLNRPPGQGGPDVAEDPNVAIVDALSPAERTAYEHTLHGSDNAEGAAAGCEGKAIEATDRAGQLTTELGDQLEDLRARIDADSRVVAAQKDWVACMKDAGYPYADVRAIRTEILHRLNPLNDDVMGEDVPEGMVAGRAGVTLSDEQRKLLGQIRSFELAVANADQECRTDLDKVRRKVRAEYEARFVDANRDRLRDLFPDADL
jgi:hypothetical protein